MAITIGIALAVPEPWGPDLREWRRGFGDDDADRMPTHITILPPNTVHALDLPNIHDGLMAAARSIEPFRIELKGSGSFRPVSDVVFVRVLTGAQECTDLEDAVRARVKARPRQHPYHPHVTVAMDVSQAVLNEAESALADYQAQWDVTDVVLYVRDRDGHWHPERAFPLGQ